MPKLITTHFYEKKLALFKKKHSTLRDQYVKTILLLGKNPFHPSLRLHKLKGKLNHYQSVSINLQYRILIDFIIQDDKIILIDIGDRSLYS